MHQIIAEMKKVNVKYPPRLFGAIGAMCIAILGQYLLTQSLWIPASLLYLIALILGIVSLRKAPMLSEASLGMAVKLPGRNPLKPWLYGGGRTFFDHHFNGVVFGGYRFNSSVGVLSGRDFVVPGGH